MGANNEKYEMLIGLYVTDDEKYSRYRERMAPILEGYGGSFRYDFTIGEVLKSESAQPINRLFILTFPDVWSKDNFFADERYVGVRAKFFEPAVRTVTYISEYVRGIAT
jgi:uncharacterized protein (DUF1330 family)